MDQNNELNNERENNFELSENILNSVNLLVNAANKNPHEQEIAALEEEIQELESTLENHKNQIKEEFEDDKKALNTMARSLSRAVKQKNSVLESNQKSMKAKLEEYEQDIKEQEEKMNKELRELEEIKKLPLTRENMLKKADLEWGVIAYQEYLEFMYSEVDTLKNSISETEQKIKNNMQEARQEIKSEIDRFDEKYGVKFGDENPTFTNHPLLIATSTLLEVKKEDLAYYKQDPSKLGNEIIEDMKNGADPKTVKGKLDALTSLIGGKVSGIIDLEQAKTLEEQHQKLQEEKSVVEKRIEEDDYFNKEAREEDEKLIAKNTENIENYQQEIEKIQEKLATQEELRKLPAMKRQLQSLNKFIKNQQTEQKRIINYSEESARDIAKMIERHERDKESLEAQIKELEETPRVISTTKLKYDALDYKKKVRICKEENLYLSEKTDEDYVDWKRKNDDLDLLETIDQDISILVEKTNALGEHDPYQMTEDILKEYEKQTNQNRKIELISFSAAKQVVLDKIKSLEFKEKAISAISNIKSMFAKKSQTKSEFDHSQMVDNVSEIIDLDLENTTIEPEYEEPELENSESVRTR